MKKSIPLILIQIFVYQFVLSQNSANDFQKLRDSIQILSSYDTVSFFNIVGKLTTISTNLKSPQKKADVLHIIGTYYYFRTDFKKSNNYYDSALSILVQHPDNKLKNIIELKRSYIWIAQGDFKKAKTLYKEKEKTQVNDTMAQILINMALGQIYQSELKNDSSLNRMYKALNYATLKKDLYYEATTRNNIGGMYQILGKKEEAKNEFLLAVKIAKQLKNKKLIANINSNIASIYIQQNKINEALNIYIENLTFYEKTNFYYEISYMYLNTALCYSLLNDFGKTKKYAQLAIKTISNQNLPVETINIYSQISNIYLSKKNYQDAINLSKEALIFSKKNMVPINEPSFYNNFSKAYEAIGDNYNALLMNKKYINQKDSIDRVTNNKIVNELIFNHQLSEKEQKILLQQKENKLLKKENELNNLNQKYYIIILIMIIVLSISITFYVFERRVKKQKELYASQLINGIDQERERIAMDLHDDLGLGITIARQKLLKDDINNTETKKEIESSLMDLLEKTRKISRDLYPSTLKHLRFEEFISNLLDVTEKQTNIICSYEINNKIDSFDLITKTHILRIIQECIHNSIKYSGANAIRIEVKNTNNKTQIIYYDNGVGFKENIKEKGLGLKNIYQRGILIDAEILMSNNENSKGVKLTITKHNNA